MTKILLSIIRHKQFAVKTVSDVTMLMRPGFNWYQMNATVASSVTSGWTSWLNRCYNNMGQMSLVCVWLPSKKTHSLSTIAAVEIKVVVDTWVHCVGSVWCMNGLCVCVHIYSTSCMNITLDLTFSLIFCFNFIPHSHFLLSRPLA